MRAAHQLARYLTVALRTLGGQRGVVDDDRLWVMQDLLIEQRRVLVQAVQELVDRWLDGALNDDEATRAVDGVAAEIARRLERDLAS